MKRLFPLHIHISTLFLLLLLLVGGLIGGFGYHTSRNMLESAAEDLTRRIAQETLGELKQVISPAEMAVNLLRHSAIADSAAYKDRLQRLGLLKEVLDGSSALSSIYIGYDSGDSFLLRRIGDDAERQTFKAPEGTRFILQSVETGTSPPRGRYVYFDAGLNTLREDERADYAGSYDPRTRIWYTESMAAQGQIKTPPYLFFSNHKVGTTIASRTRDGRAVIGADILLDTLNESMKRQKVTPGTHVLLVSSQGYVIAHEDAAKLVTVPDTPDAKPSLARIGDLGIPVLAGLAGPIGSMQGKDPYVSRLSLADGDWRVTIQPVMLEGANPIYLVTAIPDQELLAAALNLLTNSVLITLLIIVLAIPLTWLMARRISFSLRTLAGEAESIRRFEFSRPIAVHSMILEVNELARTMDGMKRTIRRFLDISQAVAAEENFDRLLPMLLSETLSAADADAGVLYLVDGDQLLPVSAKNGEGQDLMATLRPIPLAEAGSLLGNAIRDGVPRSEELNSTDQQSSGIGALLSASASRQGLAVPLLNRQQQLVGAMVLLRSAPIGEAQVSFVKALSGSAASSLETRELIKAQKELFEAFIQILASAIDAKSPYTGGHCARVPELTKMLARAACNESTGPFSDFQLSAQDWEAVHIASWLHDCGKVTTPEYVVDKATKLETLYDRIHEVRMRFEVLKRDAEIACLKAIAEGQDPAVTRAHLDGKIRQLDDDFAFIANCNEGGEFMAPEKLERLRAIAALTWLRTLDDRIGIAHEEKERKARTPAATLPVVEPLLADKPEHLFERRPQDRMPADNKWGFRMPVPELLYNKGELYNLSVGRGTLSEEERYKINEHIVQTLIMLSQLPFPKHLRQVPEIAGGHHEKMDGTGYPRRIARDEMSPLARMMAIADIFEALTAVDRPYKKGKTLSESIRIMSFMKKDQHIDPELFDLFLRSGVYREYADRFMKPEQIDEVDIEQYLGNARP
ncbi:MAG: GAF domain-containing protein [Propionivibrio sp.]|uniref:GAF domain-containing protein n=1 Tax=Candidatus Propionivibrio dominans TaxID=2954373 RepID=A0A9D7I8D6_9RHOO|nr:GAF domain-containing protein [Candidatus Propionivibrio dominans]